MSAADSSGTISGGYDALNRLQSYTNVFFAADQGGDNRTVERISRRGECTTVASDLPLGDLHLDVDLMLGIRTRFNLITELWDLRTRKKLWEIDNQANARLRVLTTSSNGRGTVSPPQNTGRADTGVDWLVVVVGSGVVLCLVCVTAWLRVRSPRSNTPP